MHWRLGLDIGTNSIGWWAFRLAQEGSSKETRWRPNESLDGGALIFPDGREPSKKGRVGDSLAVARRMGRGMRRNRDHGNNRMAALVEDLVALGLLPGEPCKRDALFETPAKNKKKRDPERYNPYRLRAEALNRVLDRYELGRVLFHLGLRRGFKSNRKKASEDDGGKLKERIETLKNDLGGRTLGQYLWAKYQAEREREKNGGERRGIRFRGEEDLYPDRAMYAAEFDAIRKKQEPHQALTADDWDRLRNKRVLFQHNLRPVERGRCEFFADEPRHWKDTPIGHDFRLYQELNSLRWTERDQVVRPLDPQQRACVLGLLMTRKSEVKFTALRKLKRDDGAALFPRGSTFNLEGEKRKGLKPHRILAIMRDDPILAPLWDARDSGSDDRLDEMFEALHQAADDREAMSALTDDFGLEPDVAKALVAIPLTSGTASVSRKFMERIVPVLRDQGLVYADAVSELTDDAGTPLHHSLRDDGRRWAVLPYYGAVIPQSMLGADPAADSEAAPEKYYGKINNPTVHVALNQLRKLVNVLVARFDGPPTEIHVELTRDLKWSKIRREEEEKKQAKNQRENERIKQELGRPDLSPRDLKKVKLWEELGKDKLARRCVFSGRTISSAQLFNGEAEIEHLLPFSRTLDDSMANLTVAMRWANRSKGNDTPHGAFSDGRHADWGIIWEEILQRAESLPKNKRWRFGPNAMERYEKEGGFIARQLTDTAYMARVAQRYLGALDGVGPVVPNPGRLTALVRGKWRFNGILADDNRKSREDHRHHAVDAAVIALTDRAVLNEVSRLSARGADDIMHLAVPELDPGLADAIRARVPEIVVSFKPDHGVQGRMYKETAYGFVGEGRRDPDLPDHTLVTRKPLVQLTAKECGAIRDVKLRAAILLHLDKANAAGEKHEAALVAYAKEHGIRRVRILVANQTVEAVPSAPYKGYAPDSYVCCDIWRVPKGKPGKWKPGEFEWRGAYWAYSETIGGPPDKAARFVMRVFKDDLVAYEEAGMTRIMRVAGFSTTDNRLDLKPHNATDAPRHYMGINVLGPAGLRKLRVTPDGRILAGGEKPS